MRGLFVWGVLLGSGVLSAASSTELKPHKVWDIHYRRQIALPPPSTSANPSQPSIAAPAPTAVNVPTSIPPPSASSTTTALILPVSTTPIVQIPALPQSTTSLAPQSSSSTPSSTGIIRISASPPLDPTAVPKYTTYPKKPPASAQKFNMLYLVPVFVLLGILWGSLSAWLAYSCFTRRKVPGDVLIGGPQYVPAPRDVEGGGSLHQNGMQEVGFSWPDLEQAAKECEKDDDDDENDPFLLPPTPSKTRSSRTKSSQSTAKSVYSELETDNEDKKAIPWEKLRHKSIKRGILEEVNKEGNRINSLRPAGTVRNTGTGIRKTVERRVSRHGRTDSNVLIGDIDRMLAGSGSKPSRPSTRRTDSAHTTISLVSTTTTGDNTKWKPGDGFRIVAESPLSSRGPTPAPPDDPSAFGMSWASPTPVDRYTHAPVRHDTTRSRSRSASPVKCPTVPTTPVRPHAAVLPQSPPQITSPLLEHSLCFTPTRAPRALISPMTTPTRRPEATSRKPRSPKPQPLPFPIAAADAVVNSPRPGMYRGRLVKSPQKAQRPPLTSKSSSYTRDADGRAVQAAIKVKGIVERSWGARDLGDEGVRTLSPTGFGRETAG